MLAVTIQRNRVCLMAGLSLMSTETQSRKEEKMSKVSRVLGAAMLCLGLLSAGIVIAQQDPATPAQDQPKKEHKMKTAMLNGTVSAVTDTALTIVDSKKGEHT